MALPRLNEVPRFEMVIPSNKKRVKFRPFLVKEQKILLMAYETKDTKQILNAITDTIESCVEGIDINELANFDVDYIFSQIRSKAVGETAKVSMPCSNCEHKTGVEVSFENTRLTSDPKESIIKVTDDISVEMKYPSYNDIRYNDIVLNPNASATEIGMETVRMSMQAILTEDERILLKDESKEEVTRFIDSLSTEQFESLSEFVKEIPRLVVDIEYDCEACGTKNTRVVNTIEDFFF